MRLGTKSCSECRRRKIRCTYKGGNGRCEQCRVHKLHCKPQEPGSRQAPSSSSASSRKTLPDVTDENDVGFDGHAENLDDAPLLHFLRYGAASPSSQPSPRQAPEYRSAYSAPDPLQGLVPRSKTLVTILEFTQRYWSVWPLASETDERGHSSFPSTVATAVHFVGESMRSPNLGIVARCLCWLALCLQQLPKGFQDSEAHLPLPISDLPSLYMDHVDAIISNLEAHVCNRDCIEALILQYKVHVNGGRPGRAWRCTRRAIDNALLLGMHRDKSASSHSRWLWNSLWRSDRHLSLCLGLPYAVPESLIESSDDGESSIPLDRVMHRIHLVCGQITDRDLAQRDSSYLATAKIAEEMDCIREMIPKEWSTLDDTDQGLATPLGVTFWKRATVFFFHYALLVMHLPYLLKAAEDRKFEYSRLVVLESAQTMVEIYAKMKTCGGIPIICDFLDFTAFTAAMILATDLISNSSSRLIEENERIWLLITGLSADFRHTADMMNCKVASQSAEVLDHLYAARHGVYDGPEVYQVRIPYFGLVSIKQPRYGRSVDDAVTSQVLPDVCNPYSTVEFSSNFFDFRLPMEWQDIDELGQDWTGESALDDTYGWNAVYEFNGVS
jgi:hypothetical protein